MSPKQYPPLEWGLCRVSAGHREHPTLPAGCSKPAEHLVEENYPEHWNYPVLSCSEQWERWSSWAECQNKHKIAATLPKGMPEWGVQTEAWTSLWNLPKIKMLKCRGKKSQLRSSLEYLLFIQIQEQTIHCQDFTSRRGLEYSVYKEETIGNSATLPSFWTSLKGILLIIAFTYLNWEETAASFWLGPWLSCARCFTNKNNKILLVLNHF